jgi:hypothetical protein
MNIPELERITFFPGQRLHADDLTDVQTSDRELRWLHNRSLHTWGIGVGFLVTGEPGESAVAIDPGYGIDCAGREIILTESLTKPIPAVAGDQQGQPVDFFLTAEYQPDDRQSVRERRRGVCLPEGTVRLAEEPLIRWKRRADLREGFELVLAQVWVRNCRLSRAVSLAVRRSARPSEHPYIGAGQTVGGATPWMAWTDGPAFLGVTVEVDTSSARFRATPHYMAHVVGDRALPSPAQALAVPFPQIVSPTPERFTLRVLLPEMGPLPYNPPQLRTAATAPNTIRNTLKWNVSWIGVEA